MQRQVDETKKFEADLIAANATQKRTPNKTAQKNTPNNSVPKSFLTSSVHESGKKLKSPGKEIFSTPKNTNSLVSLTTPRNTSIPVTPRNSSFAGTPQSKESSMRHLQQTTYSGRTPVRKSMLPPATPQRTMKPPNVKVKPRNLSHKFDWTGLSSDQL